MLLVWAPSIYVAGLGSLGPAACNYFSQRIVFVFGQACAFAPAPRIAHLHADHRTYTGALFVLVFFPHCQFLQPSSLSRFVFMGCLLGWVGCWAIVTQKMVASCVRASDSEPRVVCVFGRPLPAEGAGCRAPSERNGQQVPKLLLFLVGLVRVLGALKTLSLRI